MLDIKFIRQNPEELAWACQVKGVNLNVDGLLRADESLSTKKRDLQALQEERNSVARSFPQAKTDDDRQTLTKCGREIAARIAEVQSEISTLEDDFNKLMLLAPNIPHESAPVGPDETHNKVVEIVGTHPTFNFPLRDHVELLNLNNWADFSGASKAAGARSYALKGDMAILEQALLLLAMQRLAKEGFDALTVPALVREQALIGTGHFPTSRDDIYAIERDDVYLSGTAEVAVTSLHGGDILPEHDLPKLYVALSPCFRREAGSAGKDVKGLLRVHQFYKVEQYVICKSDSDESLRWHERLLEHAKMLLRDLELPFQVIECCTGDMGSGKIRMHDIECWLPSQDRYRETHSCSTLHDWQARRANLRYKTKEGHVSHVHTLNNTLIATPRILAPILECHQRADGSLYLPPILRAFFDGRDCLGGA